MNFFNRTVFRSKKALSLLALLISFAAAPCALQAAEQPKSNAPSSPDYVIGSEDVLEISIWKNNDLSKVVTVRPDGKISLPLIGDVQAAGSTPEKLHDAIVAKLKEYQETAIVSVIVQAVNSYKVFIIGEVKTPGTYVLKAKTTVLQALSMAGGFTQFASKNKIMLIRHKSTGEDEKLPIRFDDLVYADEKSDLNPVLRAGDTIFVP